MRAQSDMTVVAELDQGDDITALSSADVDVAVDFTVPGVAQSNALHLVDAGIHAVIGATGWDEASLDAVRDRLMATDNATGVLVAPNFGLSAVLAMRFARTAASFFESAEIIELHHPRKVDAPSGTAVHTARAIAEGRREAGLGVSPDATESGWEARGADVDGVRVHAVRLQGLVAHEEIRFGNPGEQLVIRQDSFDRSSFMPGVILAVRQVTDHPGLTVGLDHYLDL